MQCNGLETHRFLPINTPGIGLQSEVFLAAHTKTICLRLIDVGVRFQ